MQLSVNHDAAKDGVRQQWDRMAQGWSDSSAVIRPWLHDATQAMLTMAGVKPGAHVLDVAAGAGDQTIDIAKRVESNGHVLATDLSPEILRYAQHNVAQAGYRNVETKVSDGEHLAAEDRRFDAVICRLGLMLFRDPLQGLREMRRALKDGGGICTMVFSTPQSNPCVTTLMATAIKHAALPPPDPYQPGGLLSLGKPGLIDALFREAGFREIATTKMAAPFRMPSAKAYLDFVTTSAGPIVTIIERLAHTKRDAAWAEMEERLRQFESGAEWIGPNELLLTAARR